MTKSNGQHKWIKMDDVCKLFVLANGRWFLIPFTFQAFPANLLSRARDGPFDGQLDPYLYQGDVETCIRGVCFLLPFLETKFIQILARCPLKYVHIFSLMYMGCWDDATQTYTDQLWGCDM